MSDFEMHSDEEGASRVRKRGRGFEDKSNAAGSGDHSVSQTYDSVDAAPDAVEQKAARSVEGWIIIVLNVHEEATEEDIRDKFADYGEIKNLHLNLDRRTGYVKGYALVEYETLREAQEAISGANGAELLGQVVQCAFALAPPPPSGPRPAGRRGGRGRSASPSRR